MTVRRLLVANRGEIARRVFATCRRLGIETVAVHSDADAALPFVREADVAVRLPGDAPADTYLRADLVLEAARRTGADAVHPGYGFLSENAEFARLVEGAGIVWVGPSPESIEAMGSKVRSKELMAEAGVPVLPNLTSKTAKKTDLPLLVKASAGGGGRGMRVVRSLGSLATEINAARDEAASAFGDGTVFVEPYVERGRHVEVQVLGHNAGVLVLGERDCSIQRRHQKVVEESPAPNLDDRVRAALHDAAAKAAAAIDYRGAGTVEFLYDAEKETFFFLEMNTRLQVEHPVTELVHGVDLVELQLSVAEDRAIDPMAIGQTYGHAIEVRLYAEDPAADWQPQSGTLTAFAVPDVAGEFDLLNRPGVRLDSGFEAGSTVSTYYDAMLAKMIAWAPDRQQAARRLADALAKTTLHGITTNRDLLVRTLRDPTFLAGDVSTAFFDTTFVLEAVPEPSDSAYVAAALALAETGREARTVQRGIPVGWRNVTSQPQVTAFEGERSVAWFGTRDGYVVDGYDVVAASPTAVTLGVDGVEATYAVAVTGAAVDVDGPAGHVRLTVVPRFVDPADAVASGSLLAPMPGTVLSVAVAVGDAVRAGAPVLVLEAMKMQHTVSAPTDGTLTQIDVEPGAQVAAGEVLAVVEGMMSVAFTESEERQELRAQVAKLASTYGREYFTRCAQNGEKTTDLWLAIGKAGYLGVNLPEEYGGGGGGIGDVAAVCEELAAQGCPLLMMVVSPAINGTVIARYGTDEQKRRWLPGIVDGTETMAFAITEPDAGTNSHNITTTARRDGDEWVLNGRKIYISGVDEAANLLVVARTSDEKTGKLKPCLFVVPTDATGLEYQPIAMEIVSPESQFTVFMDDIRLPADALVGDENGGLVQLFAGLNPERIMAASFSTGLARYALDKATAYVKEREVWGKPIGSHQGLAHPLAQSKIEIELARLMTQKAAALYDAGDDLGAGEAANMAKYAAAEAACDAADRAVQSHGGNGITTEYGVAGLLVASRAGRIAPVSREMILNFVGMHSLGLPKSY